MRPLRWFVSAVAVLFVALAAGAPLRAQKIILPMSLAELEARVRADSNDPAAHYNVGLGYLRDKRWADAERAFRAATTLDPQFADAWLALSIVHNWDEPFWKQLRKSGGDSAVSRARTEWKGYERRAFLTDPLVDVKILGATYKISGNSPFIKGLDALVEGRYDAAYENLDKAVRYYDGSNDLKDEVDWLVWLRALAGARVGRWDDAATDLRRLLDHAEGTSKDTINYLPFKGNEYRYMIAAIRQRQGQLDSAAVLYRQVAEDDLGNFMAHVQLANILEARQQYQAAVVERQRALDVAPENATLVLDLGVAQGKASRYDDAAATLERAGAANPRDARSFYWLGMVRLKQQKPAEARAAFDRFVALAPSRYEKQIATARQRLAELPK